MIVKLLLDENISPKLADILRNEDGIDACCVRDRGLLDTDDWKILDKAFAEERVVVTCNVDDFIKFAAAREIHAIFSAINSFVSCVPRSPPSSGSPTW